jgi:hypothetical protein
MIATRFKMVGYAACVATAALGCYLVSLRVASERADLTRTERHLLMARQDIRSLQTELNTRSRLVQLERWNADVLALTAPKADQYLAGEMQLASLSAPTSPSADADAPRTPEAAALQPSAAVAQVAYHPVAPAPATRALHSVSLDLDAPEAQPGLRRALGGGLRRVALIVTDMKPSRP